MTNNFHGKVAFITGAGQGIGLQIAKQLVQEGAVVYLNDRDESLAQGAAENLQADGGHCVPLPGDVSEVERITSFIQQIKKLISFNLKEQLWGSTVSLSWQPSILPMNFLIKILLTV